MTRTLTITRGAAPPARPGELYYLKRRDECVVFSDRYLPDGSFSQIGGRGITNWVEVDATIRDNLIFSQPENVKLWRWAAVPPSPTNPNALGTLYIHRDDTLNTCDWVILMCSSTYEHRQIVRVLSLGNHPDHDAPDGYAEIYAIPYQPSGDYSAWMPDKVPEVWNRAYTDFKQGGYGPSHVYPDGSAYTFNTPLLAPMSGYKISTTAREFGGFFVDQRILLGKV